MARPNLAQQSDDLPSYEELEAAYEQTRVSTPETYVGQGGMPPLRASHQQILDFLAPSPAHPPASGHGTASAKHGATSGHVWFNKPEATHAWHPPADAPRGVLAARRRLTVMEAHRTSAGHIMASGPSFRGDVGGVGGTVPLPGLLLPSPTPNQQAGDDAGHGSMTVGRSSAATKLRGGIAASSRHHASNVAALAGASEAPASSSPAANMPHWKQVALRVMNNKWYYALLLTTALYVIFEDDVKRAALPPSTDLPLEIIITVCLVFFITEMVVSSLVKPGYFLGFYFWLDAVASASLFFEVPAVRTHILGMSTDPVNLEDSSSFIAWAGDRAFISSKTARVARIFRLLRLLRLYSVVKRFETRRRIRAALARAGMAAGPSSNGAVGTEGKNSGGAGQTASGHNNTSSMALGEEEMSLIELEMLQDQNKETRVGQKLEELIIRRIIVFVLVMVLLLPCFEAEYGVWGKYEGVDRGGLLMLHDMAVQDGVVETLAQPAPTVPALLAALPVGLFLTALSAFHSTVVYQLGAHPTSQLLHLTVRNASLLHTAQDDQRRFDELFYMDYWTRVGSDGRPCAPGAVPAMMGSGAAAAGGNGTAPGMNGTVAVCLSWYTIAVYDWKWYSQTVAILNISRSLFIISFLALGAWFLSRDSRVLVLEPIERMVARVTALADNPLALQPLARPAWREVLEARRNNAAAVAAGDVGLSYHATRSGSSTGSQPGSGGMVLPSALSPKQHRKEEYGEEARLKAGGLDVQGVITLGVPADVGLLPQGFTAGIVVTGDEVLVLGAPEGGATTKGMSAGKKRGTGAGQPAVAWADQAGGEESEEAITAQHEHRARAGTIDEPAAGWAVARKVATASHVRTALSAAGARWAAMRARAKDLLRRAATNFWDGTDEDHGTQHGPVAAANAKSGGPGSYETQILENSIQKIGALLAVGFGDAGAEVIAENIRREGDINPMVPGAKTVAIFGFCDIRRFTDATEVLQEEVMEFVNSIARIVHTAVALHGGAANKNIGDAFLTVWKFPKGFSMRDIREALDTVPQGCTAASTAGGAGAANAIVIEEVGKGEALQVPEALVAAAAAAPAELVRGSVTEVPWAPSDLPAALQLPGSQRSGDNSAAGAATDPTQGWPGLVPTQATGDAQMSVSGEEEHMQHRRAIDGLHLALAPSGPLGESSEAGNGYLAARPAPDHSASPPPPSPPGAAAAAGAQHLSVAQKSSAPSKLHFLPMNQTNRVVPLPSSGGGVSVTGHRAQGNMLSKGRVLGLPSTDGSAGPGTIGAPLDREEEALRKVMRLRSAGTARNSFTADEKREVVHAVADNALAAFVVIHAALKRSVRLARYAGRQDLIARLGEGWRVQMGFGLHVGWAIEGAIGSEYKIDASYLSPNVNMASRLEAATKQFGVSLLLSHNFVECLSPAVRTRVRQIDCVTVKGSTQPLGLFTYDVSVDAIPEIDPHAPGVEEEEEELWAAYVAGWASNEDMGATWGINEDFRDAFEDGFQAYQRGDWPYATSVLSDCLTARRDAAGDVLQDGPSGVLLRVMAEHGNVAPAGWRGVRELTEK